MSGKQGLFTSECGAHTGHMFSVCRDGRPVESGELAEIANDLLAACEAGKAFLAIYRDHAAPEDARRAAFGLWRLLNDAAIDKALGEAEGGAR